MQHVIHKEAWIGDELPPFMLLSYKMSHTRITGRPAAISQCASFDTQLPHATHSLSPEFGSCPNMPDLPEPPPYHKKHNEIKPVCMTLYSDKHAALSSSSPSNLPFYVLQTKPFLLASLRVRCTAPCPKTILWTVSPTLSGYQL